MQTGDLLRGVLAADREDRGLLNSPGSAGLLGRIDEVARSHDCTALLGASTSGQRLVGAMLFHFLDSYRVWQPGDHECVLVLEGVALGDAALAMAMNFATSAGASSSIGMLITPSEFGIAPATNEHVLQVSAQPANEFGLESHWQLPLNSDVPKPTVICQGKTAHRV